MSREPGEENYHHLGGAELSWISHGIHHPVLCWRTVDSILKEETIDYEETHLFYWRYRYWLCALSRNCHADP